MRSCTRTAIAHLMERMAARKKRPDHEVDQSSISKPACPECGNPNPRIPMRVIDSLMENEERVSTLEGKLHQSPEWTAAVALRHADEV